MSSFAYLSAPFICAAIGWFTNFLAVKMLFHPKVPIRLGPIAIQGIFPKRQQALARKLGELVEQELVGVGDVTEALDGLELEEELTPIIEAHVDRMLKEKLVEAVPMAAMFLNDAILAKIKQALVPELIKLAPEVITAASGKLESCLDVRSLVRGKVEQFSLDKLEEVLFQILSKEFRFIELIGGVLGFAIGIFQSLLFYLQS